MMELLQRIKLALPSSCTSNNASTSNVTVYNTRNNIEHMSKMQGCQQIEGGRSLLFLDLAWLPMRYGVVAVGDGSNPIGDHVQM